MRVSFRRRSPTPKRATEETKRFLREWEGYSAVIAGNDFIAAELLLVMIRDPEERTKPRKIVKTPTLIVRESCRRVG